MKRLQKFIRDYFAFSQRESNGFIVLSLLMLLLLALSWTDMGWLFPPKSTVEDQAKLQSLLEKLQDTERAETLALADVALESFDPNTLSQEEWVAMGLDAKTAARILNYLNKGGKFRKKEDVQKIYGFPPALYERLSPYIAIAATPNKEYPKREKKYAEKYAERNKTYQNEEKGSRKPKEYRIEEFDLNSADTSQLKKLRGIGSKLAARIVQYREKIGGFVSHAQLREVYALPEEVIALLEQHAFIIENTQQRIAINKATVEDLQKHPYIRERLAKTIVNYRQQHGNFKSIDDLAKIKILQTETLQKIEPYLRYD